MFGNPNISSTPIDDLFRSQADLGGNSFSNPVNPANMNPGWGIDPSLLSPSYTSSYRPGYTGSNGAVGGDNRGFFSSLNQLAPWTDSPRWGNPVDHHQESVDTVSSKPVDAGMWAAQRVAMPVMAFRAAGSLFGGYNAMGMGKNARKMGQAFGQGLGGGLARGIGASNGGMIARGLTSGMGGVVGAAAGWALPIAAAQAATWAGEKAVFNPYINTRRSADNLRDNFSGITFGDAGGNSVTGGGLGGSESSHIARKITTDGIRDMSLSTGEYGAAANMVGRSGMMDNINSKDIAKRVKDSVDQMKLIMSIAQMPEMKDAIEHLSKLQRMGASTSGGSYSDAAGTMRQLGGLASVAGTNVQKMMNTVGAQGQYLYQANGMTPYLGQIAAANNYASLSAGNRMGIISSAQLARLGGVEGATQASITGQINASQTTYNKIGNYNEYMNGGRSGSMLGNLNKFGQTMSKDPMGTYGSMMLYGNQMAGRRMNEKGTLDLDEQLWDSLKNMPGITNTKTGKIDFEKAVPHMMQMGMSHEQIMAYATTRSAETDPKVHSQNLKALNRNLSEQQRAVVERENLYGGVVGRLHRGVAKAGREVTSAIGDATGGTAASGVGYLGDKINSVKDEILYGSTIKNYNSNIEDALKGRNPNHKDVMGFDTKSIIEPKYKSSVFSVFERTAERKKHLTTKMLAEEINSAKDGGDNDAIAILNAKTPADRQKAINRFKENGKLSKGLNEYYSSPENYKGIESSLSGIAKQKPRANNLLEGMTGALGDSVKSLFVSDQPKITENAASILERISGVKGGDIAENARTAGRAYDALARDYNGKKLGTSNIEDIMKEDSNIQAFAKARGLTDPQEILAALQGSAKGVTDNNLVGFTANIQKVGGKGNDAMRSAAARQGGTFFDKDGLTTKDLSLQASIDATAGSREHANMVGDLTDKHKKGHLDFSGFQNSINALDNKTAIKKFSDAVDKLVDKWEDGSTNRRPNDIGNLWWALGKYKEGSDSGGQKVFGK